MDNKLLEQILKAVVNWNGQEILWDKHFLELQDYYTLVVEEIDEKTIRITTIPKKN